MSGEMFGVTRLKIPLKRMPTNPSRKIFYTDIKGFRYLRGESYSGR